MIPLRDQNPSSTPPLVTRALLVATTAVFFYQLALGPMQRRFILEHSLIPLRLMMGLTGGSDEGPWVPLATVFTSMFLHGSFLHLLGNMWYLWIFGDNVEDRFGHLRFLAFYLAAGAAAAALQVAVAPDSRVPTLGASGAIAGVLGAYLVAFPRARVITLLPLLIVFPIVALPAVLVLGLWVVFQVVSGMLALGMGGEGGGVAWWAHIGGFAFGVLVMAAAVRRRARPQPAPWG